MQVGVRRSIHVQAHVSLPRVFHINDAAILGYNGDKTRAICEPISLFPFQRLQRCHLLKRGTE